MFRAKTKNNFENIVDLRDKLFRDLQYKKSLSSIQNRDYLKRVSTMTSNSPLKVPLISSYSHLNGIINNLRKSRENFFNAKQQEIKKQNTKLANRLVRVKSPLSRDRLDASFRQSQEYSDIARRIKERGEQGKRIKFLKLRLPTLK